MTNTITHSPEKPTENEIWERIRAFDPKSDEISQELVDLLPRGTNMYRIFSGKVEPLAMAVKHCRPDQTTDHNFFAHAYKLGLLEEGTAYQQFCERGIIEIYSEPHGGNVFVFDVPSRKRIYPRAVEQIHEGLGDRIARRNQVINVLEKDRRIQDILGNKEK